MKKSKKESLAKFFKSSLQYIHTMVDIIMPIMVFLYDLYKNE
jgi:hypothetical protein